MRDSPNDELEEVRAGLRASVESLCNNLLGKPSTRTGSEWRWGKKGSLSVEVAGVKRGLWHDHEGGTGGDLLDLIRRERGGDFASTVDWARGFLGIGSGSGADWRPHERKAKPESTAKRSAAQAEDTARRGAAQRFWREAVPLGGTPAELYLTDARKIPRPASGWPAEAVRFHPGRCALILAATNAAGELQAVQLVHLTAEGIKREEDGRPTKQSFGPQEGAAVRLPGEGSALLLAEGPETGLSAWSATGRETWIALGSMAKVRPTPLRRLCVCADDDPRDRPAAKSLGKAVGRWRAEGRHVAIAMPWARRRFDGSDLNDLHRRDGTAAVRARIEAAIAPPPEPPGGVPIPVELARHRLGEAVAGFFREARGVLPGDEVLDAKPQIVQGIRVGVGVGKSDRARREAAGFLAEMRAAGDDRTIVFAVPTHKLGDEQARAFERLPAARAAGLRAAVWRGREAADPEAPGETTCRDLEAVRAAQFVGAHIESAVCRARRSDTACPFFGVCGYQAQKRRRADLWFVPHELLFTAKPTALGTPAAVVVDENAWTAGLEGVDGAPMDLDLDALDEAAAVPGDVPGHDTQRLRFIHRRVREALDGLPEGPLRRDALLAAGLDHTRLGRSWPRASRTGTLPRRSRRAQRRSREG